MVDPIGGAAVIGRDHRKATCHRFGDDEPEPIVQCRKDEEFALLQHGERIARRMAERQAVRQSLEQTPAPRIAGRTDHRVAAQGPFKIGLNEVSIGLPLPIYLTELAQQRLSRRHLTAATMLAHIFDPDTALDAGFVDELVEPDDLEATAVARAQHFAATLNQRAFAASRGPLRGPSAERIASTMASDIANFFLDRPE